MYRYTGYLYDVDQASNDYKGKQYGSQGENLHKCH